MYYILAMSGSKIDEHIDFLLSKERGSVYKDPGGKIAIRLAYPNVCRIGMSDLGFQGIYTFLNRMGASKDSRDNV
jgi:hypothetical protein